MRKPKPNNESEEWVKKQVKLILKDTGWKFWMPSANAFGRNGVSDFLAVKNYQLFMAIETKYKDIPTQLQLEFLKMIYDAGHYAFLVDETNIDTLRIVLSDRSHAAKYFASLLKWRDVSAEKIDS